jgi:proteasome lid subunit RPN8/RPN11
MKKVLFTVGGRPYNVAKTTPHKGFEQDGVLKSAADWMSNTFELGQKTASTMKKNEQLKQLFCRSILVPTEFYSVFEISSSYDDQAKWMADIKSFDSDLFLAKAMENTDHYDLMMLVKLTSPATSSQEEMVLLFREVENDSNEVWLGHVERQDSKKTKPYSQYFRFCETVASISEEDLEGNGAYLRALKEGRFMYVFVTTHPGPSVYLSSQDLDGIASTHSQGVLALNREVTKDFLGIFFEVYALARASP